MNRDDEIFGDAIELPVAERAAFLDHAGAGDPALRARVAVLLRGHEAADNFLHASPGELRAALAEENPATCWGATRC